MTVEAEPRAEVATEADWSIVRYAQCWEDADILLEALDIHPGDVCLSIASAGDNTLSMLTKNPAKVVAVDLSPAQMACLKIRVAAYKELSHAELLELLGATPSRRRLRLYERVSKHLSPETAAFWDVRRTDIEGGVAAAGKFEHYLKLFRRYVLRLIHTRCRIEALFQPRTVDQRRAFYDQQWNNLRWRALFRVFFSRSVMGWLGRDPRFFQYVTGGVARRIIERTRHALTELDPTENPYLQLIVFGETRGTLPHALRPENYDSIRANLHKLECRVMSVEAYLAGSPNTSIDRFNMSDVFEYVSEPSYIEILNALIRTGRPGGRLAYWNMLVPRRRPEFLADRLRPLDRIANQLYEKDKAFFYSAFVLEEIL